ncbi:MAG TPA: hypothetical protein VM489_16935 [Burkholderiales bacterium]|nr:hypothetical protein [Burkholderiales bacterium]
MRLLGAWNRIAQGHVALSAGCSCGVGVSNLRVQDFEQDILDFLRGRHGERCRGASIAELLTVISRENDARAGALLADLERSIASFEEQHSGRN